MKTLDISYYKTGLEKELSNLYPYVFIIDNMKCASFEGFIQSLKIKDEKIKLYTQTLYGYNAWKFGQQFDWKIKQTVYWNNIEIDRHSTFYTELIIKAYDCLLENENFKLKIFESLPYNLNHSIGHSDKTKTLLTKKEYLDNLNRLRNKIKPNRFFNLLNLIYK